MADFLEYPDSPLEAARAVRVVDGDTLIVDLLDECGAVMQEHVRVRLIGVNTPESVAPEQWRNTEEGLGASKAVKRLVPYGLRLWLQRDVSDFDEYDRLLRFVWLEYPKSCDSTGDIRAHMLNAILVQRGIAFARSYPPNTSLDLLFSALAGDD